MKLELVANNIHGKLEYLQTKTVHRVIRKKSMDTTMKLFGETNVLFQVVFPTVQRIVQTENTSYWSDNATKVYDTINEQIEVLPKSPSFRDTL